MGHYRLTLVGVGGHGCQRERGSGSSVTGCNRPNCPDCILREAVRRLQRANENLLQAELEHWPEDLGYAPGQQVIDDLLSGTRRGSFPEQAERAKELSSLLKVRWQDRTADGVSQIKRRTLTVSGSWTVRTVLIAIKGSDGEEIPGETYFLRYPDGDWAFANNGGSRFGLTQLVAWLYKGEEHQLIYRPLPEPVEDKA